MNAPVRELSYAQAIQEALALAMEADERVFIMGEDIGVYGGGLSSHRRSCASLRVKIVLWDTPISELGAAGIAVGAALAGSRPILEFQFSDFATLAMEQIVNQAAKMRFMLAAKCQCLWSCACLPVRAPGLPPSTVNRWKPGSPMCQA
jgi:pyruvate dehydrogenase E1 component beta subunit